MKSSKEVKFLDNENSSDDDIALIARKFRNFFTNNKRNEKSKKNKEFPLKSNKSKKWNKAKSEKKDKIKYHECSGSIHFKSKCPNLKK